MNKLDRSYVAETLAIAERMLSASFGSTVHLDPAAPLDGSDRSQVFRLHLPHDDTGPRTKTTQQHFGA